jgi:hypothetical protein
VVTIHEDLISEHFWNVRRVGIIPSLTKTQLKKLSASASAAGVPTAASAAAANFSPLHST